MPEQGVQKPDYPQVGEESSELQWGSRQILSFAHCRLDSHLAQLTGPC